MPRDGGAQGAESFKKMLKGNKDERDRLDKAASKIGAMYRGKRARRRGNKSMPIIIDKPGTMLGFQVYDLPRDLPYELPHGRRRTEAWPRAGVGVARRERDAGCAAGDTTQLHFVVGHSSVIHRPSPTTHGASIQ